MIEINPALFRLPPYRHQKKGVVDLLTHKVFGLFWQMRLGKTKVVIDAANHLFAANEIDCVVVVCPAQVKEVWLDKELGEVIAHAQPPYRVFDFAEDRLRRIMTTAGEGEQAPYYLVTSLEYLRQQDRHADFPKVDELALHLKNSRTLLVLDEGSALGTHDSLQVRAARKLRRGKFVRRVVELDGTPEGNGTMCLYPKFYLLDPAILGFKNFFHFRARHAKTVRVQLDYPEGTTEEQKKYLPKPKSFTKTIGFQNLEELTAKTAPYISRLERKDVDDMPEKISSFFAVPLSDKTWSIYRQVRDELLAELETGEKQFLNNSAVKVMRLAQVCAGFLGGFDDVELQQKKTVELSQETAKGLVAWLGRRMEEDPNFKCVVWCRWRPEIERLHKAIQWARFWVSNKDAVLCLHYGDKKDENFLHPKHPHRGAVVTIAQPQAAQYGLNFSKADTEVWLSADYNRVSREQASARIEAAGSAAKLSVDVLVTGPKGQKTVTHDIIQSLREKKDLAQRTTDQWKKILREE